MIFVYSFNSVLPVMALAPQSSFTAEEDEKEDEKEDEDEDEEIRLAREYMELTSRSVPASSTASPKSSRKSSGEFASSKALRRLSDALFGSSPLSPSLVRAAQRFARQNSQHTKSTEQQVLEDTYIDQIRDGLPRMQQSGHDQMTQFFKHNVGYDDDGQGEVKPYRLVSKGTEKKKAVLINGLVEEVVHLHQKTVAKKTNSPKRKLSGTGDALQAVLAALYKKNQKLNEVGLTKVVWHSAEEMLFLVFNALHNKRYFEDKLSDDEERLYQSLVRYGQEASVRDIWQKGLKISAADALILTGFINYVQRTDAKKEDSLTRLEALIRLEAENAWDYASLPYVASDKVDVYRKPLLEALKPGAKDSETTQDYLKQYQYEKLKHLLQLVASAQSLSDTVKKQAQDIVVQAHYDVKAHREKERRLKEVRSFQGRLNALTIPVVQLEGNKNTLCEKTEFKPFLQKNEFPAYISPRNFLALSTSYQQKRASLQEKLNRHLSQSKQSEKSPSPVHIPQELMEDLRTLEQSHLFDVLAAQMHFLRHGFAGDEKQWSQSEKSGLEGGIEDWFKDIVLDSYTRKKSKNPDWGAFEEMQDSLSAQFKKSDTFDGRQAALVKMAMNYVSHIQYFLSEGVRESFFMEANRAKNGTMKALESMKDLKEKSKLEKIYQELTAEYDLKEAELKQSIGGIVQASWHSLGEIGNLAPDSAVASLRQKVQGYQAYWYQLWQKYQKIDGEYRFRLKASVLDIAAQLNNKASSLQALLPFEERKAKYLGLIKSFGGKVNNVYVGNAKSAKNDQDLTTAVGGIYRENPQGLNEDQSRVWQAFKSYRDEEIILNMITLATSQPFSNPLDSGNLKFNSSQIQLVVKRLEQKKFAGSYTDKPRVIKMVVPEGMEESLPPLLRKIVEVQDQLSLELSSLTPLFLLENGEMEPFAHVSDEKLNEYLNSGQEITVSFRMGQRDGKEESFSEVASPQPSSPAAPATSSSSDEGLTETTELELTVKILVDETPLYVQLPTFSSTSLAELRALVGDQGQLRDQDGQMIEWPQDDGAEMFEAFRSRLARKGTWRLSLDPDLRSSLLKSA